MSESRRPPPVALTVAGSDSGGGAGIQADLKTYHAYGVFGTSVVTAITAQNTLGVRAVHAVPVATVRAQLDAVAEDLPPAASKTGMLATRALVVEVADSFRRLALGNIVVDPVMVASSGDRLLDSDAEKAIVDHLLPRAALVTPNAHEAEILTGIRVRTPDDLARAAERLVRLGAGAALAKGGHLEGSEVVNVLHDGRDTREWRTPRLESTDTHGTGCTLSAAIAAGLALGVDLPTAVDAALDFVHRAIRSAPGLGAGHGPLNHFVRPSIPAGSADPFPPN